MFDSIAPFPHKTGMEYEVLVQLKGEVLDPEGRAIQSTLFSQGFQDVETVQVAKRYVVRLNCEPHLADSRIKAIAETYLSNPVAQSYSVRRLSP